MARLKDVWRERRPELISGLIYRLVNGIGRTLKIELRGFEESPENTIYCGWHGRSFPFAYSCRNRGWWVIISQSRDGDIQNTVFERLGFRTTRGSTGRGGERAAVRAIKALRAGGVLAMTPDGPRGPSQVVQAGVMLIAQRSGAKLVPLGIAASPCWRINSWDRYVLPKPFGRALLIAGEGLTVPPDASTEEVEAIRLRLEEQLTTLQTEAERELDFVE
ncbi:DUF374 domain-containing protein [bacterium]|nr:MAG: DUF374 domain-containing protein [bacterium]